MTTRELISQEIYTKDRFGSWALWGLLGCVMFSTTVLPFSGLFGGPLLIVIWPIAGVCALIGFAKALKSSLLRRATSMAMLFAFICWPFVGHESFAMSIGKISNIVHLFSDKSSFEAKYSGVPPTDKPIWALDWSTFVTSNTFVIYDASGCIALPQQHSAWNAKDMALFRGCADHVTPIYGNYYRCDE